MSQEKVDRYKQEKANRKKEVAKQKMKNKLYVIGGALAGIVLVVWIGFSFVWEAQQKEKDEAALKSQQAIWSSYFESIMNSSATTTKKNDTTSSKDESTTGGENQSKDETTTTGADKKPSEEESTTGASK